MKRIALKARIVKHQWQYFVVVNGSPVQVNRAFAKAVYEGELK